MKNDIAESWRGVASPMQNVLASLTNVKQTGPNRFTACCPAHDSESKSSLSLRETVDGRVLIHDFGGCSTEAVLAAIGLRRFDLFRTTRTNGLRRDQRISARQDMRGVAAAMAQEASIAMVIAADLAAGRTADNARLAKAAGRLQHLLEVLR